MKILKFSLFVVLTLILVSEVASKCFSEKLGYPCCKKTTKVKYIDKKGKWGIEKGRKCGIQENKYYKGENSSGEESSSSEEESFSFPADYMSRLNITNLCPEDAASYHDGVTYPKAEKLHYYSTTTESERALNIILPVNYDKRKKYPVLYFLHGLLVNEDSMLDDIFATIQIPTNLYYEGKAKQFITVLPNLYAPKPGTEVEPSFTQAYYDGYDNFINDLINDIMPFIESNYPVLTGRENTAICGWSMGGRTSLYIGYKRSDLFGYVGSFSPAPGVVPGVDFSGEHKGLFTEDTFRAEVPLLFSLISNGSNDNFIHDVPKTYHDILIRNNQENVYFEVPGADHDGVAVNGGFYNFCQVVFGALL